jgi:hypothetical protein
MPPAPGAEIATIERSYATIEGSYAMIKGFYATVEANMLKSLLLVLQLSALATMATIIHSQFPPQWRKSGEPGNIQIFIALDLLHMRRGESQWQ